MIDNLILNEFKRILKVNRLKSGYTFKDLSKITGISDQTLRKYENDFETDIPIGKLFYLLKNLNVSPSIIIQTLQLLY